MKRGILAITIFFILIAQAPAGLSYRFDDVHGKVLLDRHDRVLKIHPGDSGLGGDVVRTGWLGRAVVSADRVASRFEIYPGSRVILASARPGVLVSIERGKLKALFEAFSGSEDRLVETPGALLAVRGTRYGVEVDGDGRSRLMVFAGAVEVRPFAADLAPAIVRAGEMCEYRHREQIRIRPMPRGMNEGSWGQRGAGSSPGRQQDPQNRPAPGQEGRGKQGKPDAPSRPH